MNLNPPELDLPQASSSVPDRAIGTRAVADCDALRVAHILRKCNPAEWGGTETAIQRIVSGLRKHNVKSVVYCPHLAERSTAEPLAEAGCTVKRFRTFLPVAGLTSTQRRQQIAVGGNLMSFDLPFALRREPGVAVIHTHALGRIGGIASLVARQRNVPLVVSIHGGYLDLPEAVKENFRKSAACGWEWGKIFGLLLRSRQLLHRADAILTCNPIEATLLSERFPNRRIIVQPHGISVELYRKNCREQARAAFPQIRNRHVLLSVGRIDGVKNQGWLVEQASAVFERHPNALLVFAGACTDEEYGRSMQARIRKLGLQEKILLTGGLPSGDARLIGLFQEAQAVVLPSISETFGLVILEAWAAGTPVIASRTSGASALIQSGRNGWLFDLKNPSAFHSAVDAVLSIPGLARQCAIEGGALAVAEYENDAIAGRLKKLYEELIEEKYALRHSARR